MSETIQIPKGWKEITFTDISKDEKYSIKRGPWGSSITKSFFVPSGYKVYQQHNVIYDDFEYGTYFLDEKKFKELKEFEVKPGDFLISCSGTIGATAVVPSNSKPGVMNQALLKISIDENKVIPEYFAYFLKSPVLQNKIKSKGAAMKNIVSVTELKKITFIIPERPIQKKIVQKLDDILGQLEEKEKVVFSIIEQNREKIVFFEKHWLHYIIDREIEKHPQQKEWKKTTVGNEIEFAYGKNLPKTKRIEGDFPVYGSNGIVGSHHEFLIDFPSIVIGRKGTIGSVHKANAKFWPTDVSFYVKINDPKKLQLDFAYFLLLHLNLPKYRQSGPKSGLNRHDAYKIEFSLPPIVTQKQIVQKIKNAEEKFKTQKTQFESVKENYENNMKYINHLQPSILDAAFTGKLVQ